MRKSTKWVVYGIVILIIAAAILFVWVYPQLDRSAQQTIRDIQTGALADDTQTESPTVDDHTEADNGGRTGSLGRRPARCWGNHS
jgi:hypothetical protein